MFDQDGLGNYGTDAARSGKPDNGRDEMDEKDQEIAHCRIVARKPKTRGIQDKLAIRHGQNVHGWIRHSCDVQDVAMPAVGPFQPDEERLSFWREQPPEKRDRDGIHAFAYDLGLTLKKYCLLY